MALRDQTLYIHIIHAQRHANEIVNFEAHRSGHILFCAFCVAYLWLAVLQYEWVTLSCLAREPYGSHNLMFALHTRFKIRDNMSGKPHEYGLANPFRYVAGKTPYLFLTCVYNLCDQSIRKHAYTFFLFISVTRRMDESSSRHFMYTYTRLMLLVQCKFRFQLNTPTDCDGTNFWQPSAVDVFRGTCAPSNFLAGRIANKMCMAPSSFFTGITWVNDVYSTAHILLADNNSNTNRM